VEPKSSESDEAEAQSLRDQIELKIKLQKIPEAIQLLEKLIQIQPEEMEWRILRGEMLAFNGDVQSAKLAFNEVIQRNPLQLEAYHGLLMTAARSESTKELDEVNDMIENAMVIAKGEKLRGLKLMYAQIRVIAGDLKESLKIYDELISENAEDFRPYLFKGVIHTVMKQKEEANKSFEKYKKLIPEDHPFAKQCDENILATQLMFQNTNYDGNRK
jgi:tetratricopeptide (TPR) repeat protein